MAGGVLTEQQTAGGGGHGGGHHGPATVNYLNAEKGIWSWLSTVDHKRLGIMYFLGVVTSLLLGGVFALGVRIKLGFPDQAGFITNQDYNKFFTAHGAVMVFLFIIPGIPAAFGNFVLPMMLGAKDVAFPRLNLMSWYLYMIGMLLFIGVLAVGGLDTGWTLYPPYSLDRPQAWPLILALLAVFIVGFSSILTGLNFLTTIHKLRAPGQKFSDLPLFVWSLYATAIIQIVATPVVGILTCMALVEHLFHIGLFLPQYGGDPVLFQHFFWFYSHPAVYIMILPAMGVQSELIATFSRKHIFGYKAIAYSSVLIAGIGFLVWSHHMFIAGITKWVAVVMSLITFGVAVPSAIKVFNWVTTLYKGNIHFKTPMCYALLFIWLFGIGGLTGMFLATVSTNVNLHDTYFVIAHFHMVMVGSVLSAFLGAVHYWWPKMTGRMYNENLGRFASILVFIGFTLTFMPQFVAGTLGMPRRYAQYATFGSEYHHFNTSSTFGALILGGALFLMVCYLIHSLFKGKKAPDNPWGAASMEWQSTSPPDPHNFHGTPMVTRPYDYTKLRFVSEESGWVRTDLKQKH